MSWNKTGFFNTVKFRVAVSYALLFVFSSLICFSFMYAYLKRNLQARTDAKLSSLEDTVICEYLTGNRYKRLGRRVPVSELPARHYNAFRQKYPDMNMILVFENDSSAKTYYNLVGESGGSIYLMRLDSNDQIYSLQLNQDVALPYVKKMFSDTVMNLGSRNVFFCIYDSDGACRLASSNWQKMKPDLEKTPVPHSQFFKTKIGNDSFRVVRFPIRSGIYGITGYNLSAQAESLELFTLIFFAVVLAILLPGILIGWLIASRFVSGIRRVNDAALEIARGDFSQRVTEGSEGKEINDLVKAFNQMNANTENLLSELKHVTDNVAHDLRTPLTRIKAVAEITVSGPQEIGSYREAITDIAEDCDGMISMINAMLEITRLETHLAPLKKELVNLNEQLQLACELFEFQAEDKQLKLELKLPERPVYFSADKLKFQRMISNLLDNAVKFTPDGGTVVLSLASDAETVTLEVRDSGCGIPDEIKPHIFKRFFRSDKSRSLPGNGLGLSMVQAIVQAHDGIITVLDASNGGTIFRIHFALE